MLSTLLGLGGTAIGLLGYVRQKKAADRQQLHYERQAAINYKIGAFNASVIGMAGDRNLAMIADQTKKAMAEQKVTMAKMGMPTSIGTGHEVLKETFDIGFRAAADAAFNTKVKQQEALFAAEAAGAQATAYAGQASAASAEASMGVFSTFITGVKGITDSMQLGGGQGKRSGSLSTFMHDLKSAPQGIY